MHGAALAMRARELPPNAKGYSVVATQLSGDDDAPDAPHRLALFSDRALATLTELPCVRVERFEGTQLG